jgi:glucokinase
VPSCYRGRVIALGIDIGGSKIAGARVDESAEFLYTASAPTRAAEGVGVSSAQLWNVIDQLISPEVAAIGLCVPGPLNPKTGVVFNPPNLPGWLDVPLADLVGKRYGLPCRVENDANAAGLAEARYGAGRGYSSVFYVTLSTGIGSGIVLDGKVLHGKNGSAGEGGHVTIDWRSASVCNCGVPGCIEALASGIALAKRGKAPERLAEDDPFTLGEICEMLAAWLGGVVSLLDPDIIVVGGGMSRIGEPLFSRLRAMVPHRTINRFAPETPIVPAALGDRGGILGAAATVLDLRP